MSRFSSDGGADRPSSGKPGRRTGGRITGILISLLVVMAAGAALIPTSAHAGSSTRWVRRYDGPLSRFDGATAEAVSPDGATVFVTGYSTGANADLDYATVAYDAATGAARWVRRYDGAQNTDEAFGVAVSPDGAAVFVTGLSYLFGGSNAATVAYDAATGATRWVRRYSGPANESRAVSVAVSPDGAAVFVTGTSNVGGDSFAYATVAYDAATGATRWVRRYSGPAYGSGAVSVAVSPDGAAVFVTGTSVGSSGSRDYATVAYDAASGATVWVRRYNDRDNEDDDVRSVAVSPDGGTLFVTGSSDFTYFTIAYAAGTGATRWHRRYTGACPCGDTAFSLAVSPDGGALFVTGESVGSGGFFDYATVAYDAGTGATLWHRRHDGLAHGDDGARSVAVSPNGATVFVTGASTGPTGSLDYLTLAYDAGTGATRWHRRYDGPGNYDDLARSVAVSPNGATVFVAGQSEGSASTDYATVAYVA